ncbi:H-NS histone family protein [Acinetobacter variabilis]|uniref:H-NS histone family protein n=1 Tax=Acinetobacter variabilis TaxID=70346 RepID=UPI003B8416C7
MEQDLAAKLANSSVAELEQISEEIKIAIELRKDKEINDARIYVRELAASLGITLEELIAEPNKTPKEKKKAVVKFRNTANENETWSGRGKQPKWLVLALENGANLEDFLIPASTEE